MIARTYLKWVLMTLYVFIARGRADSVKWLLGNGADKTLRNSSGSTPIDLAKEFKQDEIFQIISSFATSGKKKKETRKVDEKLMVSCCKDSFCPFKYCTNYSTPSDNHFVRPILG